jgi:U3 small nucleolar RNA-associated protein 25
MAKKSVKTKKKGPKGKRARAKAKLERQWGEQAVESDHASYVRGRRPPPPADSADDEKASAEENYPTESHDNLNFPQGHSDVEDDEVSDVKAVSSFLDVLRRKHRKEKGLVKPIEPVEIVEDMEDMDTEDESENDEIDENELTDNGHIDPFTSRFSVSVEDLSVESDRPTVTTSSESRKLPLGFLEEGTTLHLSHWPPMKSLSAALPADRNEWKHHTRVLWNAQKPLLRSNRPKQAVAQILYPLLATYMDICQTVPQKHERMEQIYASHILNHVWTSRQRIYQHSKEWNKLEDDEDVEARQDPKFRDQGFTRPTVLVLMPTRGLCYQFVQTLLKILHGDDAKAISSTMSERFVTEYGPPEEVDSDPRRQAVLSKKGEEWNSLFGDDVNDDDDFKLGIAMHLHEKRPPTLKLYSDFFKSDLIVASPLGLKMMGARESGGDDDDDVLNAEDSGTAASAPDYLSSIEICWVSHAHVLMMQNWDHVMDVLSWLNQRPKDTKDTDFARVRPYFLQDDLSSACWRQLILTAPYLDPSMKAAFGRYAKSRAGMARLVKKTLWTEAALTKVAVPTKTIFQRIAVSSPQEQADARLEYFTRHILPKIEKDQQPFTLIFVPSYLEFVSLRNYLLKREANYFVSVTEYARHTEVSRGRARFGQGRKSLMLYTGRAHFFHRHIIRGVRHIIWYGLPADPKVYHEVVDWCQDDATQTKESQAIHESSVLALYTACEAHALERIVGHSHCTRMTNGKKTTFLFAA